MFSTNLNYAIQNRRRMWGLGYHAPMGAFGAFGDDMAAGDGGDSSGDNGVSSDQSSAIDGSDSGPSAWEKAGSFVGNLAGGFVQGISRGGSPALMPGPPGSPSLVPGRAPASTALRQPAAAPSGMPSWGWALLGLGVLGAGYAAMRRR